MDKTQALVEGGQKKVAQYCLNTCGSQKAEGLWKLLLFFDHFGVHQNIYSGLVTLIDELWLQLITITLGLYWTAIQEELPAEWNMPENRHQKSVLSISGGHMLETGSDSTIHSIHTHTEKIPTLFGCKHILNFCLKQSLWKNTRRMESMLLAHSKSNGIIWWSSTPKKVANDPTLFTTAPRWSLPREIRKIILLHTFIVEKKQGCFSHVECTILIHFWGNRKRTNWQPRRETWLGPSRRILHVPEMNVSFWFMCLSELFPGTREWTLTIKPTYWELLPLCSRFNQRIHLEFGLSKNFNLKTQLQNVLPGSTLELGLKWVNFLPWLVKIIIRKAGTNFVRASKNP